MRTNNVELRKKLENAYIRQRTVTHYTTMEGFRSIIQNNQLWVSNIRFLNDEKEMLYGLEQATKFLEANTTYERQGNLINGVFREVVKSIKSKGIPSAYACCFCEQSDNLGQWRGYTGGGQGIAIEFDLKLLQQHFQEEKVEIVKVAYGQDRTREMLEKELNKFIQDNFAKHDYGDALKDYMYAMGINDPISGMEELILSLSPRFKHPSFNDEREWRLIVSKPENTQINYRSKDNVLVPYLALGGTEKQLPIHRVIVGPGKNKNITKQSVELFMQSFGYGDIDVVTSNVPFRT